ncbi:MAG TPA: ABC transporter ATP-binding protein [Pirellulales bacterium]|jgi:putative ABC transport system ATP-binding protein|nr:ABC transporter ATP-binding protein [Pirellulales bacterium]
MLLLRDVKKSFVDPEGEVLPILDVAEFHVAAGEQVLLMGRSGSGKTTLLQIIAGLARPDSGLVQVAGQDITKLSEAVRDRFRAQNLGYVFQTFNLLPGFSAIENVLLAMSFGGQRSDRDRAATLLGRVGLGKRLRHKPSMLSVGEQQRVAVARALANRPKLLLADEPTASVDAKHQQQIIDLIRDTCREEDVALLLVTHAREVAEQFERVEQLEQFNQALAA